MRKHYIFLHIPKTGGASFEQNFLLHNFPDQIYRTYNLSPEEAKARYLGLPQSKREILRVQTSHNNFGTHDYFGNSPEYITILRQPVPRIASLYYHIKRAPNHYLFSQVRSMSLREFASSDLTDEISNGQTRQISGKGRETEARLRVSIAKENLNNHFLIVGTTDRYDETCILLQKTIGWKFPSYKRINENPQKRVILEPDVVDLILSKNQLDTELYKYVSDKLERQIKRNGAYVRMALSLHKLKSEVSRLVRLRAV